MEEYIYKTGRPFYVGIKEHLVEKFEVKQNTPLGTYRTIRHYGDLEVKVTIFTQKSKILARKTLKTF